MTDDNENDRQLWRRSHRPSEDDRGMDEAYRRFLDPPEQASPSSDGEEILREDGELASILNAARRAAPEPALAKQLIAIRPVQIQIAPGQGRASSVWIGWTSVAASITLAAGMGLWAGRIASERAREREFTPALTLWVGNADGLDSFLSVEEVHP